jgi:hypothetical protein
MISASLLYTQQSLGGGKEIINIFHNLAKKEKNFFWNWIPWHRKGREESFFQNI